MAAIRDPDKEKVDTRSRRLPSHQPEKMVLSRTQRMDGLADLTGQHCPDKTEGCSVARPEMWITYTMIRGSVSRSKAITRVD